jgi:serine/threonine protein kinase/thiol-disulfide isomerase/thioredoxin
MALSQGQKLGPYEIEGRAGAGGMGEVYRARDTRLGRSVAIKVLPPQTAANADARSRFEREAKTISSLNHSHICVLHDVGNQDDIDYLVMEFLEGQTLDDRLKKGRLDTDQALEIAIQISSALCAAHRMGLVHRDLKPSNIMLTREGAKLLDFGLAKLQTEVVQDMGDETRTTPVTGAGTIVGTLQYMAPEQLEGREADGRADIFALGATMYEMLTGRQVFSGESKASLIGSIMREVPPSISEMKRGIPPALDRTIRKCLAKNPEDRWQSAKDLHDELVWVASNEAKAVAETTDSGRSRWQVRIAFGLLLLVIAVSTYLWITVDKERKRAEAASREAAKGKEFLSDVLTSSIPHGYGDETTVLDIVEVASQKLDAAFPDEPDLEAELRQSLGYAYAALGHYRESIRELSKAANLAEQEFGVSDDRSFTLLAALYSVYRILDDRKNLVEVARKYKAAVQQRFGDNHPRTLERKEWLAFSLERAGRIDEARKECEEAWTGYRNIGADTALILSAQVQFAWLQLETGRVKESRKLARDAYDVSKARYGEASSEVRNSRSLLAATYIVQSEIDSAKELYGYFRAPDTYGIERVFQGKFDLTTSPFQVVVFFEEWCPYSRLAMADLANVDRQYRQFGVTTLGMTRVNASATEEKVSNYLKELGAEFPVVKENGRSWNYFACRGTPSIRILSDGYLIWDKGGYTTDAVSVPMLEGMALAAKQADLANTRAH